MRRTVSRLTSLALLTTLALGPVTACNGGGDTDPGEDTDATDADGDGDGDGDGTDTDDTADTDAGSDTDDTSADDTDPVDTGGPADSWDLVITQITLLPLGDGFDLDGDGTEDNALGGSGALINPLIADTYTGSDIVGILQTWGVDDGDNDVQVGLYTARDTDDDTSDNFSGSEEFEIGNAVGPTGRALVHADATLDLVGAYSTQLGTNTLSIGSFSIGLATPLEIAGTTSPTSHTGRLGGAVPISELENVLILAGLDSLVSLVGLLADIDTDNDGNPDAVSAAFSFETTTAVLLP